MLFFLLHHRVARALLIYTYCDGWQWVRVYRKVILLYAWLCVMLQACKTRLYTPKGIRDVCTTPERVRPSGVGSMTRLRRASAYAFPCGPHTFACNTAGQECAALRR